MKSQKLLFFSILIFGLSGTVSAQFMTVDDTFTANQLVKDVLIKSPCVNVTNVTLSGSPCGAGQQSYGYFSAGTSNFPFANGIVLSTAAAKKSEGPNNTLIDEGGGNNWTCGNWPGDADLEQAVNFPSNSNATFNATVLEFDFTPIANNFSFDFLFASEEYQGTAPCRYSDGFAFLIKQKNTTNPYENLAVIPNTTTEVLVTNIHPFINGNNGCAAVNESFFGSYNGTDSPINFNGQTVVMKAQKNNLIPNTTYHIKLVIADHDNYRYDSAIFLSGGSFITGSSFGIDKLVATQNPLCAGETLNLNATFPGNPPYKWYKNDVLQSETGPIYSVTTSGEYKVEVVVNSTCTFTEEIIIEYSPVLNISNATLIQCDDDADGLTTFDLTKANVTNSTTNLNVLNYYKDATYLVEITNPSQFENTINNQVVYAKIKNQFGCYAYATIMLQVTAISIGTTLMQICDTYNQQDGITSVQQADIDTITTQILIGLPTGITVTYHSIIEDAILQKNPIVLPFLTPSTAIQIVYAKLLNGEDCYDIRKIELKINIFSPANFEDATIGICSGVPTTLSVATGFSNYNWKKETLPSEIFSTNSNSILVSNPGIYSIEVTNDKGCKAVKKFTVDASEKAIISNVEIIDLLGTNNSILINVTGNGTYEFSLDGTNFQVSNLFTNVTAGEYKIIVNDKKGCGETPTTILVLAYPTFFTPNADGFNDTWIIENIDLKPNKGIKIFDRYGKFLASVTTTLGWNGKSNGVNLPADDYWFTMLLETGREIKGHFALKR